MPACLLMVSPLPFVQHWQILHIPGTHQVVEKAAHATFHSCLMLPANLLHINASKIIHQIHMFYHFVAHTVGFSQTPLRFGRRNLLLHMLKAVLQSAVGKFKTQRSKNKSPQYSGLLEKHHGALI